jgi:hypothetical protein
MNGNGWHHQPLLAEPKPVEASDVPGTVAAALISAGIAMAIFGAVIVLGEASDTVAGWLNFYDPVGPLSGKTTVATAAYLFSWHLLHERMRTRTVRFQSIMSMTIGLLAVGVLLTFPPVFKVLSIILPIP